MDDVAINMTREFYKEILSGKVICEAYKKAIGGTTFIQNNIENAKGEVHRIKLLTPSSLGIKKGRHTCSNFPLASKGDWQCLSQHNYVKAIPTKRSLKYRESEISKLLQLLLFKGNADRERPRFFSLEGHRGMGKSSLAVSLLHYTAERKMFLGGTMLI